MVNIGVLVSGGGTNLQSLIDNIENNYIKNGKIVSVVSSRDGVYAIERATKHNISSTVISRKAFSTTQEFDIALLNHMKRHKVDLIVMAGFLSIVGPKLITEYHNRIINIHPSLIPSFCGPGFYGLKVHEAALERGVKVTGATVHFVNEIADGGPIIIQKAVKVKDNDTPERLQKRVMKQAEWKILPEAVKLFCNGKIKVIDNKVIIEK